MTAVERSSEPNPSRSPRPSGRTSEGRLIPEAPGSHPILGYLQKFRHDRMGMLLALARSNPELAGTTMGFLVRRLIIVSSPTLVNEILSTKAASFRKAPGLTVFLKPVLGNGLLTSEVDFHARQRRLLAPAFAPKRMGAYAATMVDCAERLAGSLVDGASIDMADAMMRLTFEIVGRTLFDADVTSDADGVGEALTIAMKAAVGQLSSILPVPPRVPTPSNLRYRIAVKTLDRLVYRVIEERRLDGRDRGDVLSTLLSARDEDGTAMSPTQIRDESLTLFLAGHETTANALAWTFYLLSANPAVRARLEAEVDALGRSPSIDDLKALPFTLAVFKEAMRLYPPVPLLGRRVHEDVDIGGYYFKRNAVALMNIAGIHRRPDLYPNPEVFDPTRFEPEREKLLPRCAYMPFGAGPRICIGNHFALMEAHLLLAVLARRFRFEHTGAEAPEMEPLVTLRPKGGLPVRVRAR